MFVKFQIYIALIFKLEKKFVNLDNIIVTTSYYKEYLGMFNCKFLGYKSQSNIKLEIIRDNDAEKISS